MLENGWRIKNRFYIKKGFQIESLFYFFTFMKTRIYYVIIMCAVITLGLFSRTLDFVPLFVGDILYAILIYFIVRFLFVCSRGILIAVLSLLICYAIEFLQLYQADWIVNIRNTTVGHLILGQGFLWSDLIAYTAGVSICYALEQFPFNCFNNRNFIRK